MLASTLGRLPCPCYVHEQDAGDRLYTFGHYLGVSQEQVVQNFQRYGFDLASEANVGRVVFVKGYFSQSLPSIQVEVSAGEVRDQRLQKPGLRSPIHRACTVFARFD
jgi:hypothetical protein